MAPPNLTRTDAERRAALLRVADYRVEIDLTDGAGRPGSDTFPTVTTVRFSCAEPGADSWIDLVAADVATATLNGTALDVSGYREEDGIALPGLAADNELRVQATGRYMHTGEGLHRFVDPVDGSVYVYSQFETADAKRVFACFDQPDLKARYQLTVTAPADWQVISNAVADRVEDGVHRFATSEIMSTYLVALIAGPYTAWHDEHRDGSHPPIPLGIYCRSSLAPHMDHERLFTETKQGFDFYHRSFGVRYPFGKYDQLFVPEFNAGAMENAGAVTFLEDYVFRSRVTRSVYERRAETVLHEMAHMWFGNLVTMTWWDDLWLNESFATFASVLCQAEATEYTEAWTTFATIEKSWAYRQDQLPSTHPVAADIPDLQAVEVNFDGITYAKGASVLKQLVAYVGLEPFLAGLRSYFTTHAWGNATFDDLLGALEQSSGRDLSGWGAQWLRTTGLNMLHPSFEVAADGTFTAFEVVQGGARPGAGELRTHRVAVGVYDDDDSDDSSGAKLVRTHRVEVDVEGERTAVPALVGVPRGKLVLVNDDDLTYCALRLDPDSLVTLIDRIGDVAEPLPRTLCWSAAWEMTREAELKARDFAALVAGGFGAESEVAVLQRLLLQAQTAVASYADEQWAAERGWPLLTDALRFRLDTAPAGSDAQLAVVNSLAGSVLPGPTLQRMAGWLVDVEVPDGLAVDTDLRWRLLHALVAHGEVAPERIEEEWANDPTSTGGRQAERARSLVPTAEAKERAWQRAVHDDALPNAVTEAIIGGFAHPAQRGLLGPYVERYFADVAHVWERRTSEHAQAVVIGLFPSWSVDKCTVEAADAWLADESHPPALRRLVSEGRAGIVRALGAREFDRS